MQLIVNDQTIEAPERMSVTDFIQWFKQDGNFAIAVNMEFIPRSLYSETMLKANDRIEIVLPMQGG